MKTFNLIFRLNNEFNKTSRVVRDLKTRFKFSIVFLLVVFLSILHLIVEQKEKLPVFTYCIDLYNSHIIDVPMTTV